jgi:hypothetical protein
LAWGSNFISAFEFFGNSKYATDYTSTNFILRDPVITSGGGRATSTSFELISSLRQTIIGENTSTSFIYKAGFLYFPVPVAAVTPSPSPPEGGGAGTGVAVGLPQVNFLGKTNSADTIFLLKDAQIVGSVKATPSGKFFIRHTRFNPGSFIFSLYSESPSGSRSALVSFPLIVFPWSVITITDISFGFLERRDFTEAPCTVDYNGDGRVDLVDFSILIFWFNKDSIPAHIDCNGDGVADIVDFSIVTYYWTG